MLVDEPRSSTQVTMREIFQPLTRIFPLSMDENQFQDPANRALILDAFRALSRGAEKLETHGRELNQSFDFLRRSLVRDTQDVMQLYEQQEYKGAWFTLRRLTENCFACHSRLPSQRQFDLGALFIEEIDRGNLLLKDRVRLEVAARQFDAALKTYEMIFDSKSLSAGEIDRLSAFEDYLKISIRVYNDFARAMNALKKFQQRSDIPVYLGNYLVSWEEALKELQFHKANGNELAHARELIQNAQLRRHFPADRQGLIYFIVASSLLHRYVATNPTDKTSLAEAYYLLGTAESYIRTSWIPETEFFLENAIRLDPKSPLAKEVYSLLEEYIILEFSGSSGTNLPLEIQANLDELRKLINR
jgi:hypothetical protein